MATQEPNQICVRQKSGDLSVEIAMRVAPVLAEKLANITMASNVPSDMKLLRKRIALEFYYEITPDNLWGDFANWDIRETEIYSKTVTIEKSHFEQRI